MLVTAIINNNNVINKKNTMKYQLMKNHSTFDIKFIFNLMNVVKTCLYYNANDYLKS